MDRLPPYVIRPAPDRTPKRQNSLHRRHRHLRQCQQQLPRHRQLQQPANHHRRWQHRPTRRGYGGSSGLLVGASLGDSPYRRLRQPHPPIKPTDHDSKKPKARTVHQGKLGLKGLSTFSDHGHYNAQPHQSHTQLPTPTRNQLGRHHPPVRPAIK
jgi:hypothetical protein